jgi:hypothetical protein
MTVPKQQMLIGEIQESTKFMKQSIQRMSIRKSNAWQLLDTPDVPAIAGRLAIHERNEIQEDRDNDDDEIDDSP